MVPNTASAPQDPESGGVVNAQQRLLRRQLSALDRMRVYDLKGCANQAQKEEMQALSRKYTELPPRSELEAQRKRATKEVANNRNKSWTQWCQEQWGKSPGKDRPSTMARTTPSHADA